MSLYSFASKPNFKKWPVFLDENCFIKQNKSPRRQVTVIFTWWRHKRKWMIVFGFRLLSVWITRSVSLAVVRNHASTCQKIFRCIMLQNGPVAAGWPRFWPQACPGPALFLLLHFPRSSADGYRPEDQRPRRRPWTCPGPTWPLLPPFLQFCPFVTQLSSSQRSWRLNTVCVQEFEFVVSVASRPLVGRDSPSP